MKKIICVILSVTIMLGIAPILSISETEESISDAISVKANAVTSTNGTCGTNCNWTYNKTSHTLTINGTGAMKDYTSVSTVPWYSFSSSIWEVTISSGVTYIGSYTFYGCTSVKSVSVPLSVKKVGDYSFYNCSSLPYASSAFIKNLTSIGNYAFYGCKKLTTVYLSSSLSSIGTDAFAKCTGLFQFIMNSGNAYYSTKDGVLYNGDGSILLMCPLGKRDTCTIAAGTKKIANKAFYNCQKITGVRFPVSLKTVGANAFYGCRGIKTIRLTDAVESLGAYAFYNCTGLTSIYVPDSVVSIGGCAFTGCTEMKEFTVAENNENYSSVEGVLFNKDGTTLVAYPNKKGCTYTVEKNVEEIMTYAFAGCSDLRRVYFLNHYCALGECNATVNSTAAIYGYIGSTAQEYAEKFEFEFFALDGADENIPANGHEFAGWINENEVSCTENRVSYRECSVCGSKETVVFEKTQGHLFSEWRVQTPATMENEGVRVRECEKCGLTETASIAKLKKHFATFVADGEIIASVAFPSGAQLLDEPEVPVKDGYTGEWENYTLGESDIKVNAVYTPAQNTDMFAFDSVICENGIADVNFRVTSHEKTVIVSNSKAVPLDIVLVLDQSGSMAGEKLTSLADAAFKFSNSVLQNAEDNGVEHRIAIVGFGMGQDSYGSMWLGNYIPAYENTEILTAGAVPVAYNKATSENYKNALVSVNDNGKLNSVVTNAINNISANGATRADLGLEMAAKIFANNEAGDRQRIVVFFTDGEPTSSSGFEYSVANSAIGNANQLKSVYKANVYSVGVFDNSTAADAVVQNFMNSVSSNVLENVKLKSKKKYSPVEPYGFNITAKSVNGLSSAFTAIASEMVVHSALFDNLTVVQTISKYFSLTSEQKNSLRLSAVNELGVTNDDVEITENKNGTTRVEIRNIHPVLAGEEYVVDFTFGITAGADTLEGGTFAVTTLDSGVKVGDGEKYEAVFNPLSTDVFAAKGIAVFNVNGELYSISRLGDNEYVEEPETFFDENLNFSGWDVPAWLALCDEVRVFNATLTDNVYTVTWDVNGEKIIESYKVGDVITAPEVNFGEICGDFAGWSADVPETMIAEDLIFYAEYNGAHYHKYEVTKNFTSCTEGGTLVYTCDCGDTYTEEIAPHQHIWVANSGGASVENTAQVGFRCSECGKECENELAYIQLDNETNKNGTAVFEFDFINDDGEKEQPDGDVTINISLDDCFSAYISDTSHGRAYRDNKNGTRTPVESEFNGMHAKIKTNHFSTYVFEFDEAERHIFGALNSNTEIDYENGYIFSDKGSMEISGIVSYLLPWSMNAVKSSKMFGTGSTVNISNEGETDENYTVIVKGDLNGDGVCDVLDAVETEKVINGHKIAGKNEAYAVNGCADEEITPASYSAVVNIALAE